MQREKKAVGTCVQTLEDSCLLMCYFLSLISCVDSSFVTRGSSLCGVTLRWRSRVLFMSRCIRCVCIRKL